jgi:hypothetical protein
MSTTRHITPLFAVSGQAQALESWREASGLVSIRWAEFREANRASRSRAFASYVAALDAEAAAASELATLSPTSIAA